MLMFRSLFKIFKSGMMMKTLESGKQLKMVIPRIIRSLMESIDELKNKSKSKALRKFITSYCPFVMDNIEIMSGISEEWTVEIVI